MKNKEKETRLSSLSVRKQHFVGRVRVHVNDYY